MFEIVISLFILFTLISILYFKEKSKQKDKIPFSIRKKININKN
ncbi:hypothetical protein [Malaciobacter halophilus]|nr:hypothetical protein [Malaciobacter halophilus]